VQQRRRERDGPSEQLEPGGEGGGERDGGLDRGLELADGRGRQVLAAPWRMNCATVEGSIATSTSA